MLVAGLLGSLHGAGVVTVRGTTVTVPHSLTDSLPTPPLTHSLAISLPPPYTSRILTTETRQLCRHNTHLHGHLTPFP